MEESFRKLKDYILELENILLDNNKIEGEIERLAKMEEILHDDCTKLEVEKQKKYKQVHDIFINCANK